jgi:2-succinyl-5-enolpyruvyl-6-hydroxy-3-cyclohexene-1-carboxylate synthase
MSNAQQSRFVRTLVDEWRRCGVEHAVIAPGSRSTPLVLALSERMTVHVFHDERPAGFFALGIGKTNAPAVLVSTSGTATANFHPAVIEADASDVPLIVCTADRPPELLGTGANQAIDQTRLYGGAVRWFCDPGVAAEFPEAERYWRSIACRAVSEATGTRPGPVHLDFPFREPLLLTDDDTAVLGGRAGGLPWTVERHEPGVPDVTDLVHAIRTYDQGVIVAGRQAGVSPVTLMELSEASGCPVLADPLSGLRVEGTISTYDATLRSEEWAAHHYPYPVIRLGRPSTSKLLHDWTRHVDPQFVVSAVPHFGDPDRAANVHIIGSPEMIVRAAIDVLEGSDGSARESEWLARWRDADAVARGVIDRFCDDVEVHFEGAVARDVAAAVPAGAVLFVGSSMPVRDLDAFATPPVACRVEANRGASGIDGTMSSAIGVAVGSGSPVVCLLGDVAFLHDLTALVGVAGRGVDATFVVVDNDGGGIFHFLPQARHPDFERLFATPHGLDLAAVAGAMGLEVVEPDPGRVGDAVAASLAAGGSRAVLVRTDRTSNVALRRAVQEAVAGAIWP